MNTVKPIKGVFDYIRFRCFILTGILIFSFSLSSLAQTAQKQASDTSKSKTDSTLKADIENLKLEIIRETLKLELISHALEIQEKSFTKTADSFQSVTKIDSLKTLADSAKKKLATSVNVDASVTQNTTVFKSSWVCGDTTYVPMLMKNATLGFTLILAKENSPAVADQIDRKKKDSSILVIAPNQKAQTIKTDALGRPDNNISDPVYYLSEKVNSTDLANWLKLKTGNKCQDACNTLAEKIHDAIETTQVNNAILHKNQQIDSLAHLLEDYDRVAGQIKLNRTVYVAQQNVLDTPRNCWLIKLISKRKTVLIPTGNYYLLDIKTARLQIDRNRIQDFTFVANVRDANGKMLNDSLPLSNPYWSLSFGALNQGEYSINVDFTDKTDHTIKTFRLQYGDVIHYLPKNGSFSFVTKSREYELKPDSVTTIYKKAYSDYFSFRTFLDPLGFLSNTPNGFAQLEGDAIIPLKLYSKRRATWFNYFHVNFSYIYSNSINNTPRLANGQWLRNDIDTVVHSNYINNLDFVQKAYYQFYGRGAIFSNEAKKANTWINVELGARVIGTRVTGNRSNTLQASDTFTVHKFIPELNLVWEWRPDDIFGGNLNLGLSYLANVHRGNNQPSNILNPTFLWRSPWAFPHELNLYVLTGGKDSKGGLFFRYSGWLSISNKLADHLDKRQLDINASINKTSYVPQILFGYSSNLSAMIKKSN